MPIERYHRLNSDQKLNLVRRLTIRQQSIWNFQAICFRLFIFVTFLLLVAFLILIRLLNVRREPVPSSSPTFVRPPPTRCPNVSSTSVFNFSSIVRFSNIRRPFAVKVPLDAAAFPCAGRPMLGAVLVMSRRNANAAMRREGIRRSWGGAAPDDVIIRFVIGKAGKDEGKSAAKNDIKLEEEQRKFGDLLRYDVEDVYGNLHLKMFAAFEWQMHFCPNAEFVMKTDDDTIAGPRSSDSFWPGPVQFGGLATNGATYFGTAQAVRAVMAHTSEVVGFNMDDLLYTGILAERVKPPVARFHGGLIHFRGEQKIMPQNEWCEKGVPFLFVAFSGVRTPPYKSVEEYKKAFQKIHTAKCNK
uniref:Hexosyltransferase n=1 Tax=Globodera rostochiensis TaxID=31243 RepID=A0A914HM56_GLORO